MCNVYDNTLGAFEEDSFFDIFQPKTPQEDVPDYQSRIKDEFKPNFKVYMGKVSRSAMLLPAVGTVPSNKPQPQQ